METSTRLIDEVAYYLESFVGDRRFTTDAFHLLVRVWNDVLREDLEHGHQQRGTRLITHVPKLELHCVERKNELVPFTSLHFIVDRRRYWGFEKQQKWPFGSVSNIYQIKYPRLFPAAAPWELNLISEFGLRGCHLNNYLRNIQAAAYAMDSYRQWRETENEPT